MNIGFLGYNRKQTLENFRSFIKINNDLVAHASYTSGVAVLNDGDSIFCIFKNNIKTTSIIYDYLILSDDSRFSVENKLLEYNIKFNKNIPEEFRILKDNIDISYPVEE